MTKSPRRGMTPKQKRFKTIREIRSARLFEVSVMKDGGFELGYKPIEFKDYKPRFLAQKRVRTLKPLY